MLTSPVSTRMFNIILELPKIGQTHLPSLAGSFTRIPPIKNHRTTHSQVGQRLSKRSIAGFLENKVEDRQNLCEMHGKNGLDSTSGNDPNKKSIPSGWLQEIEHEDEHGDEHEEYQSQDGGSYVNLDGFVRGVSEG